MIKDGIFSLTQGHDLSFDTASTIMHEMMEGDASPVEMAAYLVALSMKGETVEEIAGSAQAMREHAVKLPPQPHSLEIVGTGGDKSNSFNISTTSALVLAAAGVPVAKHGNRAASSQCGSADVLEALGINIEIAPEKSLELLEQNNICFLFAQRFHSAMKHVAPIRKEMGIRTIFNLLGPLTNPLGASKQLLGVYSPDLLRPMAEALHHLGVTSAMVVHGTDGLDEISLSAATKVCELRQGVYTEYEITPEQFGLTRCNKADLVGGTPEVNADITRRIFQGEQSPRRHAVVLNAAAALYVAKDNLTLEQAISMIEDVLDSGKAMKTLEEFVRLSNED